MDSITFIARGTLVISHCCFQQIPLKLLELGLLCDLENVAGMQDSDAVDKMIDSPDSMVESTEHR